MKLALFQPVSFLSRYLSELDRVLVLTALAIASIGLVMVCSASISFADHTYGDGFYYLKRHLVFLTMGVGIFTIFLAVPSRTWYRYGVPLLLLTVLLLVLVLVPGVGRKVNGSQRWIPVGPINLQISELAKFVVIIFMAGYLERHQRQLRVHWKGFLKPVVVLALIIFLLLLEPDFGSAVVVSGVVLGMLFIAGVRLWQFSFLLVLGVSGLIGLALKSPYRVQRLVTFLDPWADQYDTGYQLTQSLMAFGRGEWFGVGLGNSVQKLFYLPEAHTDFVFAIYAEEFGLVGVVVVVCLYMLLIARVLQVARKALEQQDWFAAYSCFGIAMMFAMQSFINIGMTSGLLPTKGLTLPFISYGGSSLLICCGMVALVLRINREMNDMPAVAKQVRRDRAEL